jgi:hypothetical protein
LSRGRIPNSRARGPCGADEKHRRQTGKNDHETGDNARRIDPAAPCDHGPAFAPRSSPSTCACCHDELSTREAFPADPHPTPGTAITEGLAQKHQKQPAAIELTGPGHGALLRRRDHPQLHRPARLRPSPIRPVQRFRQTTGDRKDGRAEMAQMPSRCPGRAGADGCPGVSQPAGPSPWSHTDHPKLAHHRSCRPAPICRP